jgi:hypothetical protein
MTCVHFIGFNPKDTAKWAQAVAVFGKPDFVHRYWDARAAFGGEWAPGDVRVFATGTDSDTPRPNAFDDSAFV